MTDIPSSRDTLLQKLYEVEYVSSLERKLVDAETIVFTLQKDKVALLADNDAVMRRVADLELMMRSRLQRVAKPIEDQSDFERTVAGLSQKIEDDDILHEERVRRMLEEVKRANDETKHWRMAQDESQDALWRILRATDRALGYTGLVSSKNPVKALHSLQKKNDQLKQELYRMKCKKNRLQERIYDMTRAEGSPTAADIKSSLYAHSRQHQQPS